MWLQLYVAEEIKPYEAHLPSLHNGFLFLILDLDDIIPEDFLCPPGVDLVLHLRFEVAWRHPALFLGLTRPSAQPSFRRLGVKDFHKVTFLQRQTIRLGVRWCIIRNGRKDGECLFSRWMLPPQNQSRSHFVSLVFCYLPPPPPLPHPQEKILHPCQGVTQLGHSRSRKQNRPSFSESSIFNAS